MFKRNTVVQVWSRGWRYTCSCSTPVFIVANNEIFGYQLLGMQFFQKTEFMTKFIYSDRYRRIVKDFRAVILRDMQFSETWALLPKILFLSRWLYLLTKKKRMFNELLHSKNIDQNFWQWIQLNERHKLSFISPSLFFFLLNCGLMTGCWANCCSKKIRVAS